MESKQALLVSGRFLTRIGDTSWSFALPLALIALFPGDLRPIAATSICAKLLVVLLSGSIGSWIDRRDRMTAARVGIATQIAGIALTLLYCLNLPGGALPFSFLTLLPLIIGGIATTLGASIVDIALTSDWIPTAFDAGELSHANGNLQRAMLLAEIFGPLCAGAVVALSPDPRAPLSGFAIIALLNLVSFIIEYGILSTLYRRVSQLRVREGREAQEKKRFYSPFHAVRLVTQQPSGTATLAMMFLYFTVLSPHGALLTGYMKSEWHLSESTLGFVRGAGALFGVLSGWCYEYLVRRHGVVYAAQRGIAFQAVCVIAACGSLFFLPSIGFIIFFVALVLSRLGLYTFEIAEMQLRQETVDPTLRATVGGAAWTLNYSAMIALDLLAYLFNESSDFPILMMASCLSVLAGATIVLQSSLQGDKGVR